MKKACDYVGDFNSVATKLNNIKYKLMDLEAKQDSDDKKSDIRYSYQTISDLYTQVLNIEADFLNNYSINVVEPTN